MAKMVPRDEMVKMGKPVQLAHMAHMAKMVQLVTQV